MTTVLNKGSEIAEYLTEVLSQITRANGYHTDIGQRVLRGRRKIDDSYLPCVVIIEGEDKTTGEADSRMEIAVDQDYVFGGYAHCDPDNPNDVGHLIVKDIKKALWNRAVHSGNLGRRVRTFKYMGKDIGPRADGEPMVFAVVHAQARFAEALDDA